MITIDDFTNFSVDKTFFNRVAKKVLKGENRKKEDISIALVNPEAMRKLNKHYRKHNKPTDVLSFENNPEFHGGLSEIIICPAIVKKNASLHKISFQEELTRIFIHGLLHVLGYDHKNSRQVKTMDEKQIYYLSKFKSLIK